MSFYTSCELAQIGFRTVGNNVRISHKASLYGVESICIGNNVRIDDFCILSAGCGGISIGSFVHIAAYSSIIGQGRIELCDFSNISSRVSIYSSNDDYSGEYMTNPMVSSAFTGVTHAPVFIGRHVILGAGSVVLPGAILEDGVAIGSLSLVKGRCSEFGIYAGSPAKHVGDRKKGVLELEKQFLYLMTHSD